MACHNYVAYAFAPLHNLRLPRGHNATAIGEFRIVRVPSFRYRGKRVPRKVIHEMLRSPTLQEWASVLEQGYDWERENTPRYVVYYFPPGEDPDAWMAEATSNQQSSEMAFDSFIAALRLHKEAYVSTTGVHGIAAAMRIPQIDAILEARKDASWIPALPLLYQPRYIPPDEAEYTLNARDVDMLEDLVSKTSRGFHTRLALALRRFVQSRDKDPTDRLVDLLVALEVMYGDGDPTVLAHKIAFRGATVVGGNASSRDAAFKFLKRAYASRSAILHGRSRPTELPSLERLEEITRSSLRWFVDRAWETGRAPNGKDVDRLCFESIPEKPRRRGTQ